MKIIKSFFTIILLLAFLALFPASVFASDIHVTIDGVTVSFYGQGPIIADGRVLVPVRGVFETLGFDVSWNEVARQVILLGADGYTSVIIFVGHDNFTTNGYVHTLDVAAQIIEGRTMLPIRAVLESVGYAVEWDVVNQTVVVTTQTAQEPIREDVDEAQQADIFARELLDILNAHRRQNNREMLVWDEGLAAFAQNHSHLRAQGTTEALPSSAFRLSELMFENGLDIVHAYSFTQRRPSDFTAQEYFDFWMGAGSIPRNAAVAPFATGIGIGISHSGGNMYPTIIMGTRAVRDPGQFARELLSSINAERASAGLGALSWNDALADIVQGEHEAGRFISSFNPLSASNNIGAGPWNFCPRSVMARFMEQDNNATDILNPDAVSVGIGTRILVGTGDRAHMREVRSGMLFATAAASGTPAAPSVEFAPPAADPFSIPSLMESGMSFQQAIYYFENEVIRLINIERTNHGASPLQRHEELVLVARAHSEDLLRHNITSGGHTGTDGSSPAERVHRAGIESRGTSENLHYLSRTATPENVVQGWMNSPSHRNNLLHAEWTHIGLGCAFTLQNGIITAGTQTAKFVQL